MELGRPKFDRSPKKGRRRGRRGWVRWVITLAIAGVVLFVLRRPLMGFYDRITLPEVEVGRATALKIRTAEVPLPDVEQEPWEQPPGPDEAEVVTKLWHRHSGLTRFHIDGVEIRSIGDSFLRHGPGISWFRLDCQVVAGEDPSPFDWP